MFENDSDFTNAKEARNYVKFYRQWVRNNFKSNQEGREVGENQDFVLIICPGQPKSEVRRKANDNDKQQYRNEWRAYEEGKECQMTGTPIEMLPGLPHGMADSLKAFYIYTIEQMASLPDISLQKIGMGGNAIRQNAQAYLNKSSAESTALKAEITEMTKQLQEAHLTIEEQSAKLEKANAELAELRGQVARKPGRKPKLQAVG